MYHVIPAMCHVIPAMCHVIPAMCHDRCSSKNGCCIAAQVVVTS